MHILQRIIKKPPMLFPLVALFHVAMLLYSVYEYSSEPFPSAIWVQAAWMLAYTVSWIFVCDMRHWAALVYVGLTAFNLILRLILTSPLHLNNYTDTFFPADILFSFFVLFYYRRFE